MKLFGACLVLSLTVTASAQTLFTDPADLRGERVKPGDGRELPIDKGARGLEQLLRRLNTRASILNIVAHPDDEDGGMLTYYARGLGARVADFALTRGEGGQNAMTADFGDALGLLRTQELLANDRYTGVDQMFGTEVDFGFSKTKSEAFSKWTHERVLYDAVRAVRLYRPLVITATFVGGVTDGHGQHQVSGQIAQEVFKAAGDPKIFPEMIAEGILPWQPLKVYARVPTQAITPQGLYDYATGQYTSPRFVNYVTGAVTATVPSTDVVVHEGQVDPLLSDDPAVARSYIQVARMGLGMQKSQIGAGFRNAPSGTFDVAYHRYGSKLANQPEHESTFFDGIDTSLDGMAALAPGLLQPDALTPISQPIREATVAFNPVNPSTTAPALTRALAAIDAVVAMVTATGGSADAKANLLHELRVKRVQVNNALVLALGLTFEAQTDVADVPAGQHLNVRTRLGIRVASSVDDVKEALFTSAGGIGDGVSADGYSPTPSVAHPLQRILTISPDYTAKVSQPYFGRNSIEQPVYSLKDASLRNSPSGPPALVAVAHVVVDGANLDLLRVVDSSAQQVLFVDEAKYRTIGYAGLPRTHFYPPAKPVYVAHDLKLPAHKRIGYLMGTGDAVPEALAAIGLRPVMLAVGDLNAGSLQRFDTVVLGVRTYNAHPDLHGAPTQALLDFARHGGTVVVQYQTPEFTGADAPYPLSLGSNEKVVDETAPVTLLDAASPLLRMPNKITAADFGGWVEERGHGFMSSWDTRYAALTETHDPGAADEFVKPQEPQRGGLLTAQLGEGRWTYCAFALYRQLPEGVPGAYRLLANLLGK